MDHICTNQPFTKKFIIQVIQVDPIGDGNQIHRRRILNYPETLLASAHTLQTTLTILGKYLSKLVIVTKIRSILTISHLQLQ